MIPGYAITVVIVVGAILFIGVVTMLVRRRTKYVTGTHVVLKKFRINEGAHTGPAVEISGRESGFVSWLLNLLRLQPGIDITVTDTEVSFRSSSLSGVLHTYIPLGKITATVCGFERPIWPLALAFIFGLAAAGGLVSGSLESRDGSGEMVLGLLPLAVAGILVFVYFASKRIGISVETALCARGVSFKRSLIENVSVDLPQALRAISVINNCILAAQTVKTVSVGAGPGRGPVGPEPASAGPAASGRCPNCLTAYSAGLRYCENCGFELPRAA